MFRALPDRFSASQTVWSASISPCLHGEEQRLVLLALAQLLYIDGVLHLQALQDRRLVELLA